MTRLPFRRLRRTHPLPALLALSVLVLASAPVPPAPRWMHDTGG